MDVLFVLLNAASMLLVFACWQRTRIKGFLLLAISYLLGLVGRWTTALMVRVVDIGSDGSGQLVFLAVQGVYLLVAALAVAGFWDIYRVLKARTAA